MPRGNFGNTQQHTRAGKMSSGNRTRGSDRKGGRQRKEKQEEENNDNRSESVQQ